MNTTYYSYALRLTVFCALQLIYQSSHCQNLKGTWERKTNMPTARWYPATCVVNDKIYLIGGNKTSATAPLAVNEVYNPVTDSWQTKTPMPTPRAQLSACEVGGKIYVIGGSSGPSNWTPVPNVDIYNPETDSWSKGADMPGPRAELGLVAVNGKIYAIGGIDGSSTASKSVDIYDPSTNTWSKGADMLTARGTMPACELDGKIYIFGGSGGGIVNWNHFATADMYDVATNSWSAIKDLPFSHSHLTGCTFNNKIFALGGTQIDKNMSYATVASYDPKTNTWESEPSMIISREAFKAVIVKGKIYAIGGTQYQNGLVAFANAEVYDTLPKITITNSEIRLPFAGNTFVGKLYSPNNEGVKFTFQKADSLDGTYFILKNDSLFSANGMGLDAKKKFQISIRAISENKDTLDALINLATVFKVNATYSAPNGFLLESTDKKVMIDFLSSLSPGYGFLTNSTQAYDSIKSGSEPFKNIDIIYTSHEHGCHFDAVLLYNAMKNNPNAVCIMNASVKTAMASYFTADPDLLKRVFSPVIPSKSYIDTTIAGIKLRLTNIPHSSESIWAINIMLDSIQFVHFDDYNDLSITDLNSAAFNKLPTDIALIGSKYLDSDQNFIKNHYSINQYITVSHMTNINASYDGFITKAGLLTNLNYKVNIPRWSMEKYSYIKSDNSITLDTINCAPQLKKSYTEVKVDVNEEKSIYIPRNTFVESDPNDMFSMDITINNKPLPEWAIYNKTKQMLEIVPTEAKTYTVTVTAIDKYLSSSFTTFKLTVSSPESVEKIPGNSKFSIYPNPVQSVLSIKNSDVNNSSFSVEIFNSIGVRIYSGMNILSNSLDINLSKYSQQVLFIKLSNGKIFESFKIIKE
jgi:N-acetylneuraminic acid mutarotase